MFTLHPFISGKAADVENANPYNAPKARVAGAKDDEYGQVKILTSRGRIGRLRYIAYTTGLPFLVMLLLGFLGGFVGAMTTPEVTMIFIGAGYLLVLVIVAMLTIQRSHDMDRSGWFALLVIIPIVNLIFWFIRGTEGENRFGLRPPPNGVGVIILALVFPILAVLGIVAAVALPAYQDYVKRAQMQQSQQ